MPKSDSLLIGGITPSLVWLTTPCCNLYDDTHTHTSQSFIDGLSLWCLFFLCPVDSPVWLSFGTFLYPPLLVPIVSPITWHPLLSHPATKRSFIDAAGVRMALGLNGPGRFWAEREGIHGAQRRAGMGVSPAFRRRERGLSASTAGGFAMPLRPIGSIVPCCAEGVRMELEGERGHCSGQGSGDTESLLWGHWGGVVGTVEPSVPLRLLCARAGLSYCSWTISLPPSTCPPHLSLQHRYSLIPPHRPSVHTFLPFILKCTIFCYTMHCSYPKCGHKHKKPNVGRACGIMNPPKAMAWPTDQSQSKTGHPRAHGCAATVAFSKG